MTEFGLATLAGTFGAILQELLFWYNARTKLDTQTYAAILSSWKYWVVVTVMALCSGAAAYLWFSPDHQPGRTYLLFGAAFPVLFKKAVDAFTPSRTQLGEEDSAPGAVKEYLKVS